uniref:Uncharacterized protein n=1 Tax=Siphoviridae sp. ctJhT5 TaxID=2826242 RepID=A0A8S5QYK0_9CAUD|nr:MAG TPA: hypothetical protein [Siphoviridae sp. ctJhT5]
MSVPFWCDIIILLVNVTVTLYTEFILENLLFLWEHLSDRVLLFISFTYPLLM